MRTKGRTRFLSVLLVLLMILSLLPASAFAADATSTWEPIDLADVTASDVVAITMTKDGTTWALPAARNTGSAPTAQIVTVEDGKLTIAAAAADYGWTITASDGSYQIKNASGDFLYTQNGNNGVRIGSTQDSWSLDNGYLKDTSFSRFLGVYMTNPDWRAYTSINANITGQTLSFWKYAGDDTPEPTAEPTAEPTETPAEQTLLTNLGGTPADGDTVYLYYPADKMVMTATASGAKLAGLAAELKEDQIVLADGMAALKVSVAEDVYTFALEDGKVLTSAETGNGLSFAEPAENDLAKWKLEQQADGTWYLMNVGAAYDGNHNQALEYYKGFTTFGVKADNPQYKFEFYAEINTDPVSGLKSGDVVAIYNDGNAKALTATASDTKLAGTDATLGADGKLTGENIALLTVTVNDDGKVLFENDGKFLTSGATGNGVSFADAANEYSLWEIEDAGNGLYYLKNANAAYNGNAQYLEYYSSNFTVYGKGASAAPAAYAMSFRQLAEDVEPTPEPTPEPTEEPAYNTIAEALAGENGTSFTVKGVVTMVDGKNVYVQDATGGICLYLKSADSNIKLGDTVIGSGAKKVYNGLPELDAATAEKSSGLTLSAKQTTIGALTTDDVCTYVQLKGLEVTEVYDNNGAYTAPNITLKDASDATIQIYKAVVGKTDGAWDVKVGDKVDVKAAVGINNTTLQLRNTVASEITPAVEAKVGFVTDLADLTDGAKVVILNHANKMALSQTYSGNYNSGVPVTVKEDKLSGFGASEVWTVGVNADGTYTFSTADGKKLSMGTQYTSMPLDDVNQNWQVIPAAGSENGFYIQNTGRTNARVEWYADRNYWSAYYNNNTGDLFIQQFYLVGDEIPGPSGGELKDGDQVVIYSAAAGGSLGLDGSGLGSALSNVFTTIEDGKAKPQNGAYVFTVGVEGEYYTFSAGGKYLATKNTEELFLADELADTGDNCGYWQLEQKGDGYLIKSKTARYNGGVVVIEFFSGTFSGWTFKAAEPSIFIFNFYPVDESIPLLDDVTNEPKVVFYATDTPIKQQEYKVTFYLDDLTPIEDLSVTANLNNKLVGNLEQDGKNFSFVVPAEFTAVENVLNVSVTVTNANGAPYFGNLSLPIQDIPIFDELTPAPGSKTGDNMKPVISARVLNANITDHASITINGEEYVVPIINERITYEPTEPLKEGRVTVMVSVQRTDGVSNERSWSFIVGEGGERLYFGQLHSHTTYSDGSGSLETALDYIRNLPDSANVQFVAFTDHSNYFDTKTDINPEGALYDMSLASTANQNTWNSYKQAVADFNNSQSDVIAIGGFEMTWSGGPGHINTFNSPGIVSRNNTTLNQKTNDAGMKAYYALLDQPEGADTLSQFNHPGKTFGNFSDFSYWDAVTDSRMFMVEVGNGEGQIGAGGYYPSYEQYIMALDKGWHVAPTNNQDNHKGRWGNANDARDVILTDDFSEQGIYDAIRAMRMYATEDKNLELYYNVNGQPLGSTIAEIPEQLELNVQVADPDKSDSISKVEVVVNSGKTVHSFALSEINSGSMSVTLSPDYSYYFIRVTEGDGDIAVTAPVWVGETLKLGISSLTCGTAAPVTGEELTLTTTVFNSEATPATVNSITYTTSGSVVLHADTEARTVPASGTLDIPFKYTPNTARLMHITATVVVEQNGKEFTFTKEIELDVLDASKLVYIGIDASHHNEYVAGNYKDSMGNFGQLAAGYGVRTVELKTSTELIAACSNEKYAGIVLTAPSRRDGSSLRNPYDNYTDAEIAALAAFNAAGGMIVVTGWSDYYESYSAFPAADHMAAQQNRILAALGSSLRIADDGTNDNELNGGQTPRLYFDTYNMDNPLLQGVVVDPEHPYDRAYSEVFSHYGGASIFVVDGSGNPTTNVPASVSTAVYAHATTYSADSDNDGLGAGTVPKYSVGENDERLLVMATEQLPGKGLIVVSGAAFLSNFEVQADVSSGSADADQQKNYSNYKICENLVKGFNEVEVSGIADVRAQTDDGYKFVIEGAVTSNASGYDKDTAFFDCIYVQDETGGICCFPVAGDFKVGDKVRITGYTDFYQGEPELQVTSIKRLSENNAVQPAEVPAAAINDRSAEGKLVTVKGTVESFELENGLIQTIMVKDEKGDVARVFIDGYITTAKDVENCEVGAQITATGLASYDDTFNAPWGPFPRIRIRDRADVVCVTHVHELTAVAEVPATCEADGVQAYWKCETCGKLFSDAAGTTEIAAPETIPALGHDLKPVAEVPATCGEPGVKAYWKCETCGKLFSDAEGTTEITAPEAIAALGHDWDEGKVIKEPTAFDEGILLFTCKRCGETKRDRIQKLGPCDGGDNCPSKDFQDVDRGPNSWYHEAVDWAITRDPFITDGTGKTTFSPNASCKRSQVVTFLWRAAGCPEPKSTNNPFEDVKSGDFFYKAVLWAVEQGITDGTGKTTFSPNATCTREQVVTFLWRFENKPAPVTKDNPFTDVTRNYAYDAILWAYENGITDGVTATTFGPKGTCSRAHVVTFLYRDLGGK